jgi:hypothetical protein
MSASAGRPTRIDPDLYDAAILEGARESRSAREQIEHWARVGKTVSGQHTASRRRVEAVLAGALPITTDLTDEEFVLLDAEVEARIEERLRTTNLGAVLGARGETIVALDAHGVLTEYRPDGTSSPV